MKSLFLAAALFASIASGASMAAQLHTKPLPKAPAADAKLEG